MKRQDGQAGMAGLFFVPSICDIGQAGDLALQVGRWEVGDFYVSDPKNGCQD